MKRWLFLVHRYTGIALCLLMAAWCLSGIVMMYVRYPYFAAAQRLPGQAPLELRECCRSGGLPAAADDTATAVRVEMLLGHPVLRWRSADYRSHGLDLADGHTIAGVSAAGATRIAREFARRSGRDPARMAAAEIIERDQWTVQGNYDAHRPLYRFALNDRVGTELYVSGTSGEVVQQTTFWQRFWNYPGAVTHWLYPTALRAHPEAWSQVVVWISLAGAFLVVTGLWAGILQWKKRGSGRRSPYRGAALWHHVSGLLFGLFALGWVASGCFSMNPWGFLGGTDPGAEMEQLSGAPPRLAQVLDDVRALAARPLPADVRSIEGVPLEEHRYWVLRSPHYRQRVDAATLRPANLLLADLLAAAAHLRSDVPVASADVLQSGDTYWYSHHESVQLPALRLVFDDAERTHYYLDTFDGHLLGKVDGDARGYRWLFSALHQWDFSPALRTRPLWDIVVVGLLLGMSTLFLSGVWIGVRRVRAGL